MTCALRLLPGILLLAAALALPAAQPSRRTTERDLKAVNEQIERQSRQLKKDEADKAQLSRELREAERRLSGAHGSLRELRDQRAERAAERRKLLERRTAREAERQRNRTELARQLRSAYFVGRNEPLKLLLNQREIGEVTRNLTYYGYFGRVRAGLIAKLDQEVAEIAELTARIEAEDAELARLEAEQKSRVEDLDTARKARQVVLDQQNRQYRTRAAQLERMRKEQQELEQLIKRLAREQQKAAPFDPDAPFARMRDKLSWPVAGRIVEDYGVVLGGNKNYRSPWILIETRQGTPVRAVHDGVVAYVDWVAGRGNVIVLNHGNDYLTLYGHNEKVFRSAGDRVKAGEVIATAGDTGGRNTPALWFQIRRRGDAVNPHLWMSSPRPSAN